MKRWIVLVLIIASLFCCQITEAGIGYGAQINSAESAAGDASGNARQRAPEDILKLYAQSAVLMDGDSGRILYGKGEDTVRPMASTTKIMTCILALEMGNPDDMVRASSLAASQPKVHLGVREGEEYRLEDLLYALMLESYNDAAVMIAEHIGGSVEGFADMMNKKAESLGCKNTYFITPNGLDGVEKDENGKEQIHSTTAAELALIMRYCVMESPKKENFLKITRTQNHSFGDQKGRRSFSMVNHNAFLNMMEGMLSGKTGFTGGAGYSYVGALEDNGRTYIIALLGCGWPPHKTYKWTDARKLFTYGKEHYKMRDVYVEEGRTRVLVAGGICWDEDGIEEDSTGISMRLSEDEKHLPMLLKDGETVRVSKQIPSVLQAPIREGQQVGYVDYTLDGILVKRFPVYADQGVEEMTFSRVVKHIVSIFTDFGRLYHIF